MQKNSPKNLDQSHHPVLAACLIIFASALMAGINILAKLLGKDYLGDPLHPFQISFGRFAFALLLLLLIYAIKRPILHTRNLKLHVVRAFLGWSAISLIFAAISIISLPDATAISFLSPIFTMFFAILFLGEYIGKYRWLAAMIALSGAFILLRPGMNGFQPGALLALLAAVLLGAELVIIKSLTNLENKFQILIINNIIGTIISGIAVYFVWQTPNFYQFITLVGIGFTMVLIQTCFIIAIAMADISFVAPFSFTTLIFATVYDFTFFSQIPDYISIIGALTILVGALISAWRETIHR